MTTTTAKAPASRGQLTDQGAEAAIDTACRKLGLPTVRAQAAPAIAQATRTHTSYAASSPNCSSPSARTATNAPRPAGSRLRASPATST